MSKVLYLSGVFPNPLIKKKINENDILLVTAKRLESKVFCVFTIPYSNILLSKFSDKYKEYYTAAKTGFFYSQGFKVITFPILNAPVGLFVKKILFPVSLYFNLSKLERFISDNNINVVHAQSVVVDCFISRALFKKYGVPYLVTVRGLPNSYNKLVHKNLESAKVVITLSAITQRKVKQLYNIDSVVIPHGVDDVFFRAEQANKELLVGSLDRIKLVTVCRLIPLKNIDKVVYAISKSSKDIYLDIYGDGEEMARLKHLVSELNLDLFIEFKGRVDNNLLPSLLVNYDCFVMPSLPESLGRVYFEAMASGLPVIGVKGTGIDGAITDGHEGFLLGKPSVEELLSCFNHDDFNNYKLAEMGENAKMLAEGFRWNNTIEKLECIYSQVHGV